MTAQEWPTDAERQAAGCRPIPGSEGEYDYPTCTRHDLEVIARPDGLCDATGEIYDALAEPVARREREAAARALREAADEADAVGHNWSGGRMLAFFAIASGLRERANRIESSDMTHPPRQEP